MIRREKLHALILSRRNVGEADRLLTLLTRDYGLLKVVAKGVRKIPSRRGSHLEPFTHVLAIVAGSAHRYFLAGIETVNEYVDLRQHHVALAQAHNLAQITMSLFEEEQPQPTVFDALHHAWDVLPTIVTPRQRILEAAVMLHTLHQAGWLPDLTACHRCGITQPTVAVIFDSGEGGWRCLSCHASFAGTTTSLSPRLLKAIRFIARYPERALQLKVGDEESWQIIAALRHYVGGVIGQPLLYQEQRSRV
ncbi:MAG: DNA repair protein RecO [Candidatus Andersenbacteria bacterium]